mmetsp:Transcript_17086/g.39504  ORF Transcript_17086/g.39504 Transcript_17086/m.39504 type:complete len:201 (-) Transcript_17086:1698-2300(-)
MKQKLKIYSAVFPLFCLWLGCFSLLSLSSDIFGAGLVCWGGIQCSSGTGTGSSSCCGLDWHLKGISCNVHAVRFQDPKSVGPQNGVQLVFVGKFYHDILSLQLDREGEDFQIALSNFISAFQTERFLVQWASHLGSVTSAPHDALRQHEGLLVGAHVLGAVPFAAMHVVEDGELGVAVKDGGANVGIKVGHLAYLDPLLF